MRYPAYMNARERRKRRRAVRKLVWIQPKNAIDMGMAFMLDKIAQDALGEPGTALFENTCKTAFETMMLADCVTMPFGLSSPE